MPSLPFHQIATRQQVLGAVEGVALVAELGHLASCLDLISRSSSA